MSLERNMCTACGACENICPTDSIMMIDDKEGFLYPQVDKKTCINCGRCKKVCPLINRRECNKHLGSTIYIAWSLNDEIRKQSSSGGIFTELAMGFFDKGGYVAGAIYDENYLVRHYITDRVEELSLLRKSKYVQSKTGLIFKEIESILEQNKHVMFVGTPCQSAGLRGFLSKDYDKLLICDLVCHGVNSPKVYRKYIDSLETTYQSKMKTIDFRDKRNGWNNFGTRITFESGQEYYKGQRKEPFYRGFIQNLYLRKSCYDCRFKTLPRNTDITLADFWGIEKNYKDIDTKQGISLIIIHNEKGQAYFDKIGKRIFKMESNIEFALPYNPCILKSSEDNKGLRDKFFDKFLQNQDDQDVKEIIKSLI